MATKNNSNTVLLVRNAAPNDFGGAETYPVSLAEILKSEGWNPIVVTASQKLLEYSTTHGVQTIKGKWLRQQNWTGWRLVLLPLYVIWQLYLITWYIRTIKRTGARTLHVQSRDDFIAGTIAGKILRRTVIWTDHMDLRYIFENITKPMRNIVGKLVFMTAHYANHIILISDNEHRLVTKHFSRPSDLSEKITIIKNGVIDKLNNVQIQKKGEDFIFCIASRLVKNKGIAESIEAFSIFTSETSDSNAKLYIYGDGKDAAVFKAQAKGINGISFFGHTDQPLSAIASGDVYMLPSYQEGFSIALLEAIMLGKAIISSDVDSNPEIIKDTETGILVPARDPIALASAMKTLYQNRSLIKKYGDAARQEYLAKYDLEKIVATKILPLY